MDSVSVFTAELMGLYETKPPISKAKMASITRGAMKAIKLYKHVVQSVEKFISKCKPEYKVPGLYVIDSIVRQSRHQFGAEKDVFAPRFARNMQTTFASLFQCAPEDKSKIIRVLNLWQKNNVFAPEVIQPLFDLADPNHPIYQNQNIQQTDNSMNTSMGHSNVQDSSPMNMADDGHTMSSDMSGPITIPTTSQLDSSTIRQLQQLQQFLLRQTGNDNNAAASSSGTQQDSVKFNKNLLDYDYGDDEEEDKPQTPRPQNVEGNIAQLLSDPNVLRQLQTLQLLKQQEEKQSKLTEMRLKEEAFEKHLATVLKKLPFANECDLSRTNNEQNQIFGMQSNMNLMQQSALNSAIGEQNEPEVELVSDDGKVEVINLDGNSRSPSLERDRYNKRRRSRSRSRDRTGARRRRTRSRSRSPRSRRRTSRDRDRNKDKEREREKDREYERERRRKGLPIIKKEHLSVCSTTLWVGHLSKLVQQEELSDTFMKYGDIVSIDMIHPRGCAFIVMNRRQDAHKAMVALKNYKLQGRVITISWAAGKGVKSKEWKDYWDLDSGASYVPWSKIDNNTDFDELEEGGMYDEDTMPNWLKEKLKNANQKKDQSKNHLQANTMFNEMGNPLDTTQPPPTGPPIMQNVSMVPQFPMGPVPRLMPPIGLHMTPNIVPGMPLGVPPPQMNAQMMMQPGPMLPGVPPPSTSNAAGFMGHFAQMTGGPMPPQMPPHMSQHQSNVPILPSSSSAVSNINNNNSSSDDHMDIDMDDEPTSVKMPNNQPINSIGNVGPFSRPPPQLFNQTPSLGMSVPPAPSISNNINLQNSPFSSGNNNKDNNSQEDRDRRRDRSDSRDRRTNSRDRERERDFRGSGDRGRERERDVRNKERDRNDRDSRDRRSDYNNRDRDRNSSTRWGNDRGRSRDNEMAHRDRRNSRERDRNTRDRNDRDKSLTDRLRDMAGDNNRIDFNRRNDTNTNEWRDGGMQQNMSLHGGGGGVGGNFSGSFMDQNARNIRPLNLGPMNIGPLGGGPPPSLTDLRLGMMDGGMRGPQQQMPQSLNHRGEFDFNRDEFDRRNNMPRDFFNQNRFGGPPVQGPRGPMGMVRPGPPGPFGQRMGPPMFMRGPRPGMQGPPIQGFNERQFFDRENMRGGGNGMNRGPPALMNENRRDGPNSNVTGAVTNIGNNRQNWNDRDRDDENLSKNRFEQNDESKDNKRSTSRWGNTSPKSVVSDEENWDDDDNELRAGGGSGGGVGSGGGFDDGDKLKEVKNITKSNISEPALLQTEPIDDDSQEDDFNDFDETVAAAEETNNNDNNDNNDHQETLSSPKHITKNIEEQNDDKKILSPKSNKINNEPFDMFSNESDTYLNDRNPSPIPQRERKLSNNVEQQQQQQSNEIKSNKLEENNSEEINQNTTPLYDEPENNDEFISKQTECIKNSSLSVTELEQPEIPGIDPIENENDK